MLSVENTIKDAIKRLDSLDSGYSVHVDGHGRCLMRIHVDVPPEEKARLIASFKKYQHKERVMQRNKRILVTKHDKGFDTVELFNAFMPCSKQDSLEPQTVRQAHLLGDV